MKKIPVGRFAAFATVTALVLIASSFALMSVAEGPEAEIEFDLNGGTLNGQGTFFRTESSLVTGLPDISDTVMPAGKDEFVVWSASPTSYSQIYNIGDPVPSGITTFYAIWGVNLDVSANMTVSAAGCYIVNGGSAPLRDVDVTSTGVLLVLERANLDTMNISKDVTLLLRYAEDAGTEVENKADLLDVRYWQDPPLNIMISSASTGTLNAASYSGWSSNLRIDGGCLKTNEINIKGTVVVNGTLDVSQTVNGITVKGKIQSSSVEINGSAICSYIGSSGPVTISGNVETDGKIQGSSIDIEGDVSCGYVESSGPVTISGNVETDGKIQGSSIDIEGDVSCGYVESSGPVTISGNVETDGKIQGSSIDIEGDVSCGYVESSGPVTISGNVETDGKIQGSSIDIGGSATCDHIYSGGPVIISGNVDAEGRLQGSTITITGTADVGSIYTGGALTIDGNVNVDGHMQGTPTNVNGGTVIADSAWPDPNVTGTAVVIIGKQDYVPAGSEYIMIVPLPGFNTSGISDVLVKFKLSVNGLILDVVLWLPDITDKISLGPNTSPVASADGKYWMEISYVQNGKEYVTSGEMIYQTGASPKYYLCEIGEGTEVNPDDDELVIISRPSVYDSPEQIFVAPSMTTVRLILSGNALDIAYYSDEILISVPDTVSISGFWGTWNDLEEDPDGGYILMDRDFEGSGTFVLFVVIPVSGPGASYNVITPVCITAVPELSFTN